MDPRPGQRHHPVLYLQASSQDVAAVRLLLETPELACEITWVDSRAAFQSALENGWRFELILADSNLPELEGPLALRLARSQLPEIPFLYLSSAMDPATELAILGEGATDCLCGKSGLARLTHAVRRALAEAALAAALREARASASRTAALLQSTLEATSEGVLVVDLAGKVIGYNRRLLTLCGIPPEVMAPMRLDQVLTHLQGHFQDSEAFLREAGRLSLTPGKEDRGLIRAQPGPVLEALRRPFCPGITAEGSVFRFREVSGHDDSPQESKAQYRRSLHHAVLEGTARVLQAPLAKLRDRLELLAASRPISLGQGRHLTSALATMDDLDDLLRQVSGTSSIPAVPALRPIALNQQLERLLPRAEALLPKGIRIELEAAPELLELKFDAMHLEQVVMILVGNARDALGEAGTIVLRTGALAKDRQAPGCFLEVDNPGSPLPAHIREQMFDPFFTTKPAARGLGLWLARQRVEAQGGSIQVKSTRTGLTRLRVEWPALPDQAGNTEAGSTLPAATPAIPL